MTTRAPSPTHLAEALEALRERPPLVQCLTNTVAMNWTANALLAVGATPAMVDNPEEAAAFARVADGVLVNLGTPQGLTVGAMSEAVGGAGESSTPWVLDPIAAGSLPWRTEIAVGLLDRGPAVVRGNASEVRGLLGGEGGRGPDSTHDPESALDAATELARRHGTVVAVSGRIDHITDGERLVRVANGHDQLTRVTGIGCCLGALMAGFAARTQDPLTAAVAATSLLTVAAEDAAATTEGPGSFAVALLDRLYATDAAQLADRALLS